MPDTDQKLIHTTRLEYSDISLDDVMDYFVRGYKFSSQIVSHEWFIDSTKGRMVFKLYVTDALPEAHKPSS